MNSENILKFYGSKLGIKLDTSEYYDFELVNDDSTNIDSLAHITPIIDLSLTGYTCSGVTYEVTTRRPEKGWSLEFIFNRNSLPWISGGTFYYTGIVGDDNPRNYADNNLSFGFTEDGRIRWSAIHYSGICETVSGYTESYYIASGQTEPICTTGLTKDFSVVIVFDRKSRYTNCDIENEGGQNDLVTGYTLNNSPLAVMSGDTPDYSYYETLNKKWNNERKKRLGTLKIYLNDSVIYKLEDWEEVIPSIREESTMYQLFGMGTPLMGGIHDSVCCFTIKSAKYYIEPLDFVYIKYNFSVILATYDIFICGKTCDDDLISYSTERIFLIDLGSSFFETSNPWNNFAVGAGTVPTGTRIYDLMDTTSRPSKLSFGVTSNDWTVSVGATVSGHTYPDTATRDSLRIGNSVVGSFSIRNCDVSKKYEISLLSSRGFSGDITYFTVQGVMQPINPANNTTLLVWYDVIPIAGLINIFVYQPTSSASAYVNIVVIKETLGTSCGEGVTGDLITEDDILISLEDGGIITY